MAREVGLTLVASIHGSISRAGSSMAANAEASAHGDNDHYDEGSSKGCGRAALAEAKSGMGSAVGQMNHHQVLGEEVLTLFTTDNEV